jgi:CHASE2 domain-containing sensor protein
MENQPQLESPQLIELKALHKKFEGLVEEHQEICKNLASNNDAVTIARERRREEEKYKELQEIKEKYESLFREVNEDQPDAISKSKFPEQLKLPSRRQTIRYRPIPIVLTSSALVTFIVLLVRFFGGLQPLELFFYDSFMRSQTPQLDKRILVIEVNGNDYDKQKERDGGEPIDKASLSNRTLSQLLTKLKSFEPIAIGLDMQRDQDLDSQRTLDLANPLLMQQEAELKAQYEDLRQAFINGTLKDNSSNASEAEAAIVLFTVCKANDDQDESKNSSSFPPPPAIPASEIPRRVGFADFPAVDADGNVLRRNLLAFKHSASDCQRAIDKNSDGKPEQKYATYTSFGLLIANHYLKNSNRDAPIELKNDQPSFIKDSGSEEEYCDDLQFTNGVVLPNFQPVTGGYQGYSQGSEVAGQYGGCQSLLKYRGYDVKNPDRTFRTFNVEEILNLNDSEIDEVYKNRIILIGITRRGGGNDYWITPYGEIPGVIVQAHMISQILDAVTLDQQGRPLRSLIQVLPEWQGFEVGEIVVIWVSSMIGGALGIAPLMEGVLGRFSRHLRVPIWFLVILAILPCIYYSISAVLFASRISLWLPFIPSILTLWLTSGLVVLRTRNLELISERGRSKLQDSSKLK